MTVNYGTDASGVGDIQPFTYNPGPTDAKSAAAKASNQQEESAPQDAITQDKEESDVVVKKSDEKPKPKVNKKAIFKHNTKSSNSTVSASASTATANPTPAPPKPDVNALFNKGAYGKPNNSQGDGTGGTQGDQGKPDGDPNSRNYLGDGSGNGNGNGHGDLNGGYSLANRKRVGVSLPTACNTPGKVVIKIKVDRSGHVTDAEFDPLKSQSYDDCNKNNALIAARKQPFDPSPNAPEIQEGTITYIYRVH